ncbi:MAG: MFS transporter [Microbacteriaceae bacterium]
MTVRDQAALQRRTRSVLVFGQIMAGLGMGATLTMGALLAEHITGNEAWSGMAATMSTLGSAVAAIPLARLAQRRGRAFALGTGAALAAFGALLIVSSSAMMSLPVLLLGLGVIGIGGAVNLQARFAATDLATPATRGRDLSLVVWATTLGAVAAPNLNGVGAALGDTLGMPHMTGPFLFTIAAQLCAAVVYVVGLRPDPLSVRREMQLDAVSALRDSARPIQRRVTWIIATIGLGHATMVGVMSMTPVHLVHHGASLASSSFAISLHVAGMYAFSPVFGILADRIGRLQVMFLGQAVLLSSLVITATFAGNQTMVTVGLFLLGLGWSANTVAGSTLVVETCFDENKTRIQGRSDLVMSASGALAGAVAGPLVALVGYSGLSVATIGCVGVGLVLLVLLSRVRAPETTV